ECRGTATGRMAQRRGPLGRDRSPAGRHARLAAIAIAAGGRPGDARTGPRGLTGPAAVRRPILRIEARRTVKKALGKSGARSSEPAMGPPSLAHHNWVL